MGILNDSYFFQMKQLKRVIQDIRDGLIIYGYFWNILNSLNKNISLNVHLTWPLPSVCPSQRRLQDKGGVDWGAGGGVAHAVHAALQFRWCAHLFLNAMQAGASIPLHSIALPCSCWPPPPGRHLSPLSVPDIVETLLPLLSSETRTRRQVVVQLVHMGLVDSAKQLKKPK